MLQFERVVHGFSDRLAIIDNQLDFVKSYLLGARAFEVPVCNHWPGWGVELVDSALKHVRRCADFLAVSLHARCTSATTGRSGASS